MIVPLFYGALIGGGLYLLVRVFLRPAPGLATVLSRIDGGVRSMSTYTQSELEQQNHSFIGGAIGNLADRLEVMAADRGWRLRRVRTDLAIMGRTTGVFLANKVILGLFLFLIAPVLWAIAQIGGVPISAAVPALLAILLGLFGFFLPDLVLKSEAENRRKDFRRVVGIFLDLVAMNLAGGRGLPEALLAASTISEQWCLIRIRQALANARLMGTTPWESLGLLGTEIGVEELRDLSAALVLAADDGAKIRQSLSARAATLRRRELADAEGEAGEKSQSMLVAQMLLCFAFVIFLVYPAMSSLLAQ